MSNETGTEPKTTGTDPKTVAIISYITLIGWIVALILNNPKSDFASFHIRQMLGLILAGIALQVLAFVPFLGWIVSVVGWIALLVFWVLGFIGAIQGEKKLVPVVGEYFQEWFKSL